MDKVVLVLERFNRPMTAEEVGQYTLYGQKRQIVSAALYRAMSFDLVEKEGKLYKLKGDH